MQVEKAGSTITLKKTFDAPKALVFSMFQSPHIEKWWGPQTYPVKVSNQDFRVGGSWHYAMVGPNDDHAWGKMVYDEIDEPNKIVAKDYFSDAEGNIDQSKPTGTMSIMFDEADGKTTITSVGDYGTAEAVEELVKMGMVEGVTDTWNQLEKMLADAQK